MKNRSLFLGNFAILFFFLFFIGCDGNPADSRQPFPVISSNDFLSTTDLIIPIKPIVKVTQNDYDHHSFMKSFPDTLSLNLIAKAYSNSNYSENVKTLLNCYMQDQVKRHGENFQIFEKIQTLSKCNLTGAYILPTYAEKAKYEGKDVWIIQVTNGFISPAFGHYKCFAFGIEKLDTVIYFGCR